MSHHQRAIEPAEAEEVGRADVAVMGSVALTLRGLGSFITGARIVRTQAPLETPVAFR
jgi:hypothetical protein